MIRIAVYDDDFISMSRLEKALDFYAVNRNTELDVTWFVKEKILSKLRQYADNFHIAFVSIKAKNNYKFCELLYRYNRECRICYYSVTDGGAIDLTNPIWFMDNEPIELNQKISGKLDNMFHSFRQFGSLLMFDTRQLLYIVPIEDVFYLQSDLKYVNIVRKSGENINIYKKLDEVEKSLSSIFLRIHKSYIVNSCFIKELDKVNREIILKNGERLPISNSRYNSVVEFLNHIC